jgi:hypothetical protein
VRVLADLAAGDSAGRLVSELTDEWMYVFKRRVAETRIRQADPPERLRDRVGP